MITFLRVLTVVGIISLAQGLQAADSSFIILEDKLSDLIFRSSRSIVTIEAIHFENVGPSAGSIGETVHRLISSGIVFDDSGNILASATSVISHDRLYVNFEDQVIPARLVGIDYHTGLALIHIDRNVGVPVSYGQWQGCAGQLVIALGNSFGVRASPTIGFCAGSRPDGTMQFSAQINSGTIGGGIFNLSGNLIGVITGGIGHGQLAEAGLAVSSEELQEVVTYISTHGDRPAGYVGVTSMDIEISPGIAISFSPQMTYAGAPSRQVIEKGIMITDVVKLSPAENVGLLKGDLVFSLNGNLISSVYELRSFVRQSQPGTLIEVGFLRNRTPYVVPIQVGRVELAAFEGFQSADDTPPVTNLARDSILSEIKLLKKTLQQLEVKLRNLR